MKVDAFEFCYFYKTMKEDDECKKNIKIASLDIVVVQTYDVKRVEKER